MIYCAPLSLMDGGARFIGRLHLREGMVYGCQHLREKEAACP